MASVLVAVAIASCGPERTPDARPDEEAAGSTGNAAAPSPNPGSEVPSAMEPEASPFRNFPLPPDPASGGEVRRHPVRIENPGPGRFLVTASAGAAPVVLDTLDAGESYRVDLKAPAGALRIRWRSLEGRSSGEVRVQPLSDLQADSVTVVRLEPVTRSD
ncbi:MAG: hypothetical protein P8049_05675 [Gemmatimonadota bacterium]